ncbi:hypothetical protein SO802_004269 [Lithocarpus litseifolius]|uniref:Metallo-beta-lactamase domain-containing protein n=1 Tax=Lithocarpus litseifolius TaxID=425828 RepID=A0AAW2E6E4_9ROSI
MSIQSCLSWLLEVKPSSDCVGPLIVVGLVNDSIQPTDQKVPSILQHQEYPPGVKLVPIGSKTAKPFRTINLIIFATENVSNESENNSFVACGDALIVDPGCRPEFHEELQKIVAALPWKVVVFVTHHHWDHVDGKFLYELKLCLPIKANKKRKKGGKQLKKIASPQSLRVNSSLIKLLYSIKLIWCSLRLILLAGYLHSEILINIGEDFVCFFMHQYFQTTYKFMELSPHTLIPMHGRVNLWPKHMLCGYLKNRRSRETSIWKAIENGAETLFDIVAEVYSGFDRSVWIPAASNVRLHVEHLAEQDKLPKGFSLETFNGSLDAFADKVGERVCTASSLETFSCNLAAFADKVGLYSIYLHTSPEFTEEPPESSVFYQCRIPSKQVEWGQATMVDAKRCLLANAPT